ncbi:MAG: HlyD family efflux transporter periplasmic adaptor subunit [Clostridia bacterium]|nr:HlyD family efflux transporter periplasmic adaptor subunit [Clostridia bacterium]
MADWFRKFKSSDGESPAEDFILTPKETPRDTSMDDTGEIPCIYDEMLNPAPQKNKGKKGLLFGSIAVIGVILVAVILWASAVLGNPLRGYAETSVAKGSVIDSFQVSGTLSAAARYEITSLVAGKVAVSGFEVGERVSAGSVLYQLDDTEAKLALERAKAQLNQAQYANTTTTVTDRIYAPADGTIYTVNIRPGGSVSYGQVVATIKKEDESTVAITSPYAGTVSSVYATEGKAVSINSLIAAVTSVKETGQAPVYDRASSQLDVQVAEAHLKNFTITSPIDGVIVEKNTKAGDNVGVTDTQKPMMVILDTSSLKFSFRVDEYELRDIEQGMLAVVKTESMPDASFSGEITRISAEGIPDENGKPFFDVEITVTEPGDLKPGMQVTATVIRDSANNTMYLPHKALMEADGQTALVLVKNPVNSIHIDIDNAMDESLSYPWIQVPKGCKLVRVSYGVADDTNVEILFGLKVGDVVVYNPDAEPVDLAPAVTPSPDGVEITPDVTPGEFFL